MENEKPSWLTEGVLITLVPLLGYTIAFAYQSGIALYYGVPLELVKISLPQILIAVTSLVAIAMVLFMLSDAIYQLFPEGVIQNIIIRRILMYSPLFLLLAVFLCLFDRHWKEWGWIVLIILVGVYDDFLRPLILQRSKPTYIAKIQAQWDVDSQSRYLISVVFRKYGTSNTRLIMFLVLLVTLSYSVGRSAAMRQTTFYIDEANTNTVLLACYDDTLIYSTFEPTNRMLSSSIEIRRLSDALAIRLNKKNIGGVLIPNENK